MGNSLLSPIYIIDIAFDDYSKCSSYVTDKILSYSSSLCPKIVTTNVLILRFIQSLRYSIRSISF